MLTNHEKHTLLINKVKNVVSNINGVKYFINIQYLEDSNKNTSFSNKSVTLPPDVMIDAWPRTQKHVYCDIL